MKSKWGSAAGISRFAAAMIAVGTAATAQGLRFRMEQNGAGGCITQAGQIMTLSTVSGIQPGGMAMTIAVQNTIAGQTVSLFFGSSAANYGGNHLPVFTHGPYLLGPEFFGPWCGWYTDGSLWATTIATGTVTSLQFVPPVVPSAAFLNDFLWVQAIMSDPTPGWYQQWVTSNPVRLRVVL